MASTRFPGKPLAPILDKPMIAHVWEAVTACDLVTRTVVATCDDEIAAYVRSIGGDTIMTSDRHERASDRCAEALAAVEEQERDQYDIVVMIQGDEPMTRPEMIGTALQPMIEDETIQVVNLVADINDAEEFEDRNCIKVVSDLAGNALYYSREPIPTRSKGSGGGRYKQVCIIPFRRDYLLEYVNLDPTPLEVAEAVDMMRVLEHGGCVRMVPTRHKTYAVDVPADLLRVEQLLRERQKLR